MMIQQMPCVRRQVRKLLLYICGSKESYRHLRDVHALETHMKVFHFFITYIKNLVNRWRKEKITA